MSISRLLAIAATTLVAGVATAAEVDLRPQFNAGDESRYEINGMAHNVTRTNPAEMLNGGETAQMVTQQYRVAFKVIDVQEDHATIEATYEHIKVDLKSPAAGMPPSFDSDSPAAQDAGNTLAPVLRPIVGARITLQVSSSGEIMKVSPPDLKPSVGPLGALAMQFVDPVAVKSNFAMIFNCRNDSGVAEVGGQWQDNEEHTLSPGASLAQKMTLTLTSVDDDLATIDITGSSELKVTGGQMQGARIEDSSISGQATWNLGFGMLQSADIKNSMRLTIEPQPGMQMTTEAQQAQAYRRLD